MAAGPYAQYTIIFSLQRNSIIVYCLPDLSNNQTNDSTYTAIFSIATTSPAASNLTD